MGTMEFFTLGGLEWEEGDEIVVNRPGCCARAGRSHSFIQSI